MKYFCRVTKQPKIDLERKTSVHFSGIDTDVTKEEVAEILNVSIEDLIVIDNEYCQLLPGLCGYRMDAESETEVFKELQEFKDSEYIPFDGSYEWHIFEGEPMNDSLPDGNLFIPLKIIL